MTGMISIKLMTDVAADILRETAEKYNIDVMSFPVTIGDQGYDSVDQFTNQEFYQILLTEPKIPTHAQITTVRFLDKFEEIYRQGFEHLIYVSINRLGSSTYDNAVMASKEFYEDHPEAKDKFHIHIIDSKTYSYGYGYSVVEAAKKIERGFSAAEVVAYLKDWADSVEVYFAPYSLEFVKKSGRVSCAAAFVGELLGLKPIIAFIDGQVSIIEKVRGEKAIIPALLKHAKKNMIPQTPYCIIKGMLEDEAVKMQKEAEKALGYPAAETMEAGPVIVINAGPKIVAIVIKGKNKHIS